jgi:hypothetical protein
MQSFLSLIARKIEYKMILIRNYTCSKVLMKNHTCDCLYYRSWYALAIVYIFHQTRVRYFINTSRTVPTANGQMQKGGGGRVGRQRGDHRQFLKNSKTASTDSKLSENCQNPFLSSKQSLSTDKNMFWNIFVKCKGGKAQTTLGNDTWASNQKMAHLYLSFHLKHSIFELPWVCSHKRQLQPTSR